MDLGILILIGLAAVGAYFYFFKKSETPYPAVNDTTTKQPEPTVEPAQVEPTVDKAVEEKVVEVVKKTRGRAKKSLDSKVSDTDVKPVASKTRAKPKPKAQPAATKTRSKKAL